ncbi:MAG TPA: hypothetical protein VMT50_06735 [Steroidobacteraceae bacterium]|nr:hypothetical protein [Steroidobacteraceae bacterium]
MRSTSKWGLTALWAMLGLGAVDFEQPPEEKASASLPPELASGVNFEVAEPVISDGLMHHYVLKSRFGEYPAYGQMALRKRVHEVAALTALSKKTDVDVVTSAVESHVKNDAKTVKALVTNPVGTVTGIPRGIGHLFGGFKAQAKEFAERNDKKCSAGSSPEANGASTDGSKTAPANAPAANAPAGNAPAAAAHADAPAADAPAGAATSPSSSDCAKSGDAHPVKSAKAGAARYADRYLGLSAAERRYYKELDVDPYTDNEALHKVVKHLARVESAANLGLHFAGIPGVPYLSDVRRAMDAIYNEDPAVIRERQRKVLAGYGLESKEVEQFENTLLLSPTSQAILVEYARMLDGVAGRDEVFRHAMAVTSKEEVQVFIESLGLLAHLHATHPLSRILAGLRLPGAESRDGHLIVAGAFDAVYWTEEVARYESAMDASLPAGGRVREAWSSGRVSERARQELTARGWEVHEGATALLDNTPAHAADTDHPSHDRAYARSH